MFTERDIERHASKVYKSAGCWLWAGPLFTNGYGQFYADGKNHKAHRASYQIHRGNIPEGMIVCHSCDVKSCVNPNHLFLGTAKDNVHDCVRKKRQRFNKRSCCIRGHEYTDENTAIYKGHRVCRKCGRDKKRMAHRINNVGLKTRIPYGRRREHAV